MSPALVLVGGTRGSVIRMTIRLNFPAQNLIPNAQSEVPYLLLPISLSVLGK